MKITWAVFDKYIISLDEQPNASDFVQNPVVVLQTTGTPTVADKHYEHTQAVASTTWTINHNLGKICSVVTVDSLGREWFGSVTHNSINQVVVEFAAAFGGKAYCN